jgi:hypothetical protein
MTSDSDMREKSVSNRAPFAPMDAVVYALILALSALPFFFYERAPDFVNSDVHYAELADSLLHSHSYSADFTHEGLVPPGFPIILASICATLGCTHDILTRAMPVFLALGLLLSYEVLRRQRGRLVAAVSCVVLAASPGIFPWVTSRLWPIFPYLCISMIIFLLIPALEASQRRARTRLLGVLLCLLLIAAVMIESIGIALVAAILAWLILSFLWKIDTAKLLLRRFLPIALIALVAEGLWLQQGGNAKEWPLPGFPGGYLAQLKLKDGNYPESGFATPKDVLLRVEKNLKESAIFLGETLFQRWINPSWTSLVPTGLVLLILCGLASSLCRSDSRLCALYFIFFECVYLLWPWFSGVVRFAVAVLPLAYLYLAEGVLAIQQWSRQYPRRLGALFLPLSMVLVLFAAREGWAVGAGHGFQAKISAICWSLCASLCVRLIWKGSLSSHGRLSWLQNFSKEFHFPGGMSFRPIQGIAVLVAIYLVSTGVAAEVPMGRENLVSGLNLFENAPDIQAARWIASHTDPSAIIASGGASLIHHYSRRNVHWFPPISNPEVVMAGIRRLHIQFVVVITRRWYYFLPPETVCFDLLQKAYPQTFRLVAAQGQVRIYEVLPDAAAVLGGPAN